MKWKYRVNKVDFPIATSYINSIEIAAKFITFSRLMDLQFLSFK